MFSAVKDTRGLAARLVRYQTQKKISPFRLVHPNKAVFSMLLGCALGWVSRVWLPSRTWPRAQRRPPSCTTVPCLPWRADTKHQLPTSSGSRPLLRYTEAAGPRGRRAPRLRVQRRVVWGRTWSIYCMACLGWESKGLGVFYKAIRFWLKSTHCQ